MKFVKILNQSKFFRVYTVAGGCYMSLHKCEKNCGKCNVNIFDKGFLYQQHEPEEKDYVTIDERKIMIVSMEEEI